MQNDTNSANIRYTANKKYRSYQVRTRSCVKYAFPHLIRNILFPSTDGDSALSLNVLEKITRFTRGEEAIVNSCDCNTRLHLVLQTSHSLAIARFPH